VSDNTWEPREDPDEFRHKRELADLRAQVQALTASQERMKELARREHDLIASIEARLREIGHLSDSPGANITGAIHGIIDGYVSYRAEHKALVASLAAIAEERPTCGVCECNYTRTELCGRDHVCDVCYGHAIENLEKANREAEALTEERDAMQKRAEAAETCWQAAEAALIERTEERDEAQGANILNRAAIKHQRERAEAAERLAAELHERVTEWQPLVNAYNANHRAEVDPEGEAHEQRKRAEKAERLAAERLQALDTLESRRASECDLLNTELRSNYGAHLQVAPDDDWRPAIRGLVDGYNHGEAFRAKGLDSDREAEIARWKSEQDAHFMSQHEALWARVRLAEADNTRLREALRAAEPWTVPGIDRGPALSEWLEMRQRVAADLGFEIDDMGFEVEAPTPSAGEEPRHG
jgi:hypothetical protein